MVGSADGVMSIGSRGGERFEEVVDEGRMGMDLCSPWWCGSAEKGLRRASATEAMTVLWVAQAVSRRGVGLGC